MVWRGVVVSAAISCFCKAEKLKFDVVTSLGCQEAESGHSKVVLSWLLHVLFRGGSWHVSGSDSFKIDACCGPTTSCDAQTLLFRCPSALLLLHSC